MSQISGTATVKLTIWLLNITIVHDVAQIYQPIFIIWSSRSLQMNYTYAYLCFLDVLFGPFYEIFSKIVTY